MREPRQNLDPVATISINGQEMTLWERVQNMFFSFYLDYVQYSWRHEQVGLCGRSDVPANLVKLSF